MMIGEATRWPNGSIHPTNLTPEIQTTLAALVDVETRHEIERERLERYAGPDKERLRGELAARHQAERTPLVQHLAFLQQALTWAMMVQRQRDTTDGFRTVLGFGQPGEAPLHAYGWSA
jgi:hypothetical protein